MTYQTYSRTDVSFATLTVLANGETEIDLGCGVLTLPPGPTESGRFLAHNNAELVEILGADTMKISMTKVVDLMDEAKSYDFLLKMHGHFDRR